LRWRKAVWFNVNKGNLYQVEGGALMSNSYAFAGPKVAVVMAEDVGSTHDIVGKSFKMDFGVLSPAYGNEENKELLQYPRAEWTPESAAAIEKMVRKAIELTGDCWPVKKGDTVLIKPSLVSDWWSMLLTGRTTPEDVQATVTDPRVVRGIALVALESGASKVLIGELPAHGDAYYSMIAYGYGRVEKELQEKYSGKIEVIDMRQMPEKAYKPETTGGLCLKEYVIPEIFITADVVISVANMKTHSLAGVTGSLKNIGMGAPSIRAYGSPKLGLPHQKLAEIIADVNDIIKPDYAVIDGIWGMEGNGPEMGTPIAMDLVVAGNDLVAVDWVMTGLMGMVGELQGTIRMAAKYGVGTYEDVEVVGKPVSVAGKQFEPVPRQFRMPGIYSHNVWVGQSEEVDLKKWSYK
jgi:uncharacterized protein (DUF362 family)